MAIEINGSMTGSELKTQLEKIATKGELCSNLTTSFKDVSNPICTLGNMVDQTINHWVSMLVLSLYCWEDIYNSVSYGTVIKCKAGFSTRNRILDEFKNCAYHVGAILFNFARSIGNNFSVFPLDGLAECQTWESIFSSKPAVDSICSFYPLFSMVDYMFQTTFPDVVKGYDSKIQLIKDGYFWSGYMIENGYQSGIKNCLCGVFIPNSDDDGVPLGYNVRYSYKDPAPVQRKNIEYGYGGIKIQGWFTFSGFSCPRRFGNHNRYYTSHNEYRYYDFDGNDIMSSLTDNMQKYYYIRCNADIIPNKDGGQILWLYTNGNKSYKLGAGCAGTSENSGSIYRSSTDNYISSNCISFDMNANADETELSIKNAQIVYKKHHIGKGICAFKSDGYIKNLFLTLGDKES